MDEPKHKPGETFGDWTITRYIASGANGEVWEAASSTGDVGALKILSRFGGDGYTRFRKEIETLRQLDASTTPGVLPLIDSDIRAQASRHDPPWLVMPLATEIRSALDGASVREKVDAIRQIARALEFLVSSHNLHHRDVKPSNLYWFEGQYVIGDFGLAKGPEDPAVTAPGHTVGPKHLLPSEAFLDPHPDWELIDVHCLALSLWLIVSGEADAPRGARQVDDPYSLTNYSNEDYVDHLDAILVAATDASPGKRPRLAQFGQMLDDWLVGQEIRHSFEQELRRSESNRRTVLRWLVGLVQREPFLGGLQYQIDDPQKESEVPGLTEGDVSDAIEELVERGEIEAEPQLAMGREKPYRWVRLYPTSRGVREVEDEAVMEARCAPLLRQLLTKQDVLSISRHQAEVEIGEIRLSPAEAYFLLRYLYEHDLVSYRASRESRSVLLLDVRTTSRGKDWLLARFSLV